MNGNHVSVAGSSTHRLLKAFLLVEHLSECLEDFDTQLLLFIHELLGVFNQPDRVTRDVLNHLQSCPANAVTGAKTRQYFIDHHQVKLPGRSDKSRRVTAPLEV